MISGGARQRFSSVALALLGTLLIGGIAAPIIVSIGSDRITVSSSSLVAAPRDSVIVTTPTPLGQSRLITLDRGFLYPADAFGRALETPLSRAQLASGGTRIVIENGYLRLRGASASGDAPGATSPLLDALADLQFESVFLRKTTVLVALPDGRTEAVTDIDGEVTHRRKSAVTLKGRGELRGQRVTFELTTGLANDPRPGTTVPLKLSIKSVLADLSFDGRANVVGAANITGAVEIKVPHVRQIARWFGAPWSNGNGLRNLQAQGQIEWAGPAIAFNRASVLIDGNEATGTLHLNFTAARPSIGGTLALKSLDLGRYFPSHDDNPAGIDQQRLELSARHRLELAAAAALRCGSAAFGGQGRARPVAARQIGGDSDGLTGAHVGRSRCFRVRRWPRQRPAQRRHDRLDASADAPRTARGGRRPASVGEHVRSFGADRARNDHDGCLVLWAHR